MTYKDLLKLAELVRNDLNHQTNVSVKIPRDMIRQQDGEWQWRDLFGEWHRVPESVLPQLIEQLEKENPGLP